MVTLETITRYRTNNLTDSKRKKFSLVSFEGLQIYEFILFKATMIAFLVANRWGYQTSRWPPKKEKKKIHQEPSWMWSVLKTRESCIHISIHLGTTTAAKRTVSYYQGNFIVIIIDKRVFIFPFSVPFKVTFRGGRRREAIYSPPVVRARRVVRGRSSDRRLLATYVVPRWTFSTNQNMYNQIWEGKTGRKTPTRNRVKVA